MFNKVDKGVARCSGRTHLWMVPLRIVSRNGERTKNGQIFVSWALGYFTCFHNYKLFFSDVYQLYGIIYGLKVILEFKKLIF